MSEETKNLVRESWNAIKEMGLSEIGIEFFTNVFTEEPGALSLFSFANEDIPSGPTFRKHALNVLIHVGYAVKGLDDLNALVPVLRELGSKHNGKGIKPEHFDLIGRNLIKTFADRLGERFTAEVRDAWVQIYGIVAETMKSGITF